MSDTNQSISIIQDLSIILVADVDLSKIISYKTFVEKNIVDSQWRLKQPETKTSTATHMFFENGIHLVCNKNSLTFLESTNNKEIQNLEIISIIRKFVDNFSELSYKGISINPNTFLVFPSSELKIARNYIFNNIFSSNIHKQLKVYPVRGSIYFDYILDLDEKLNNRILKLNISEKQLQISADNLQAAVSFNGHFNYQIFGKNYEQKHQHILQIIKGWKKDFEDYLEIVNKNFLNINSN